MALKSILTRHGRQFSTVLIFVLLCTVLWILTPFFFTLSNLVNVVRQTAINAVIAVGMTFVIISGGIDLSVGSVVAFSGVVLGSLLHSGVPVPLSVAGGLAAGALCGAVNGVLITRGKLPPFIATLGMMSVARGAALTVTGARPISGFPGPFRFLATGEVLHVPMPVIIMIVIYLMAHVTLRSMKFGRYAYAIGGNEEAARLSGIKITFYKSMFYILCGTLSGLAAVILTARLNSAQPIAGIMYELDAIAAAVIGGTSLMGGEGSVMGTLLGALIMGVLRNGLNLLGVSSQFQQLVIGAVIISAVWGDIALKKRIR